MDSPFFISLLNKIASLSLSGSVLGWVSGPFVPKSPTIIIRTNKTQRQEAFPVGVESLKSLAPPFTPTASALL